MLANLGSRREQVVDARGRARFSGEEADFRANIAAGHIPGSRNLPYNLLFQHDGTFCRPANLKQAFEQEGIDLDKPIVTTCGGGVTAAVLLFALHLLGKEDVALYVDQIADMDPRIFLSLIRNYDNYDGSTWLHTVKAPTRILAGEDDLIIPLPQQELLHQLIPGSEFEVIRHGSHCPQMDLPDLVNSKIEEFLRKLGY